MTTHLNVQTLGGHGRLFVEPNWYVDSISSLPECDLAVDVLKEAVERIERNLASARAKPEELDHEWFRKANGALKLKKLALIKVAEIRQKLEQSAKADKLAEIKRLYSEAEVGYGPNSFCTDDGNMVQEVGDGHSGILLECCDEANPKSRFQRDGAKVAHLVAELLNFASEL
jgi:hypothetical protein